MLFINFCYLHEKIYIESVIQTLLHYWLLQKLFQRFLYINLHVSKINGGYKFFWFLNVQYKSVHGDIVKVIRIMLNMKCSVSFSSMRILYVALYNPCTNIYIFYFLFDKDVDIKL